MTVKINKCGYCLARQAEFGEVYLNDNGHTIMRVILSDGVDYERTDECAFLDFDTGNIITLYSDFVIHKYNSKIEIFNE